MATSQEDSRTRPQSSGYTSRRRRWKAPFRFHVSTSLLLSTCSLPSVSAVSCVAQPRLAAQPRVSRGISYPCGPRRTALKS